MHLAELILLPLATAGMLWGLWRMERLERDEVRRMAEAERRRRERGGA